MVNLKRALLSILMILPLSALASGGEVLLLMELQVVAFVALIIILFCIRIPYLAKICLLSTYLMSSFFNIYSQKKFTYGYYLDNEVAVNLRCLLPQIAVTILVYYLIRNKFKQNGGGYTGPNELRKQDGSLRRDFDGFIPEKSADEIIGDLKESRNFNRNIEEF